MSDRGMPSAPVYYHGGKRGLSVLDVLAPSPPHITDGRPICVARAKGRTVTVGEFREWVKRTGHPNAGRVLASLAGANPAEPIDPPTGQQAIYVTSDRDYAMWYAARSQGDLYQVVPIGMLTPSPEDHFPTWTVDSARIIAVLRRKVHLRNRERRRIERRWKEADERTEGAR